MYFLFSFESFLFFFVFSFLFFVFSSFFFLLSPADQTPCGLQRREVSPGDLSAPVHDRAFAEPFLYSRVTEGEMRENVSRVLGGWYVLHPDPD